MNCVICLETGGERQNKHFQKCHCVVFYHQHCWQQYKRHFNCCPICRSELKIPYLIASLIVIPILLLVILLVHADYRNNFSSYLLGYVLTLFSKNLTTRELIFHLYIAMMAVLINYNSFIGLILNTHFLFSGAVILVQYSYLLGASAVISYHLLQNLF